MSPLRPLVELFSRHRNAANLLFISMILLGAFGLANLNVQFFPSSEFKTVRINVVWPGATALDVDKNIVATIQPEVRFMDGVKEVTTNSKNSLATISVEFMPSTDMQRAIADVEAAVNAITTLPKDAEQPLISQVTFLEETASVLVSGPFDERALRSYAKQIRDGLLDAGIDKVDMEGFRDEEIWVEAHPSQLRRYNLTTQDIAGKIAGSSLDVPGGVLRGDVERQVRAVGLAMDAEDVGNIVLRSGTDGRQVRIADVADVSDTFDAAGAEGFSGDDRAIRLTIRRTKNADALEATAKLRSYIEEVRPTLPPTLNVDIFDVNADKIVERISVLLFNGLGGMALVLCILFLFLNGRIAFWVAAGIPASLMATFGVMWWLDMSINMLSTFALIMTVGIIVDDAIVVGEHSATLTERGHSPQAAAEGGAIRMVMPITAAALTTLAAFIPMLVIDDTMGQIVRPIPLVVLCVLIGSLVECFFVLPGHLSHALSKPAPEPTGWRKRFFDGFDNFRETRFRRFVTRAYDRRYTTAAVGLAVLIIAIGLIAGGRASFRFFPSPEGEVVQSYVFFQPGAKRSTTAAGVKEIEAAAYQAERNLAGDTGEKVIGTLFSQIGRSGATAGDERAYMYIELTPSEERTIRTAAFVKEFNKLQPELPGLRYIYTRERRGGPPGRDIDIRLKNADAETLKRASSAVVTKLEEFGGISRAFDDLYYNKNELLLKVNERGDALGFTNQIIGNLARGNLQGVLAKRFARGDEEVTVRVLQPRDGSGPQVLEDIEVPVPGTQPPRYVPLTAVVDVTEKPGFASIKRTDGQVSVRITADYDDAAGNPNEVLSALDEAFLPALATQYGVQYSFGGRNEEQSETLGSLRTGALIGLTLIYVVLAFVFASYSRPIIIMAVIPFGLVGTVFGHVAMGYDLTFLSMVGLLGLSGIMVNNSIILISRIEERRAEGEMLRDAVINGICDRFRAVLLTSLTTVLGLAPLLFERSIQAQFLMPMVITISWGLAFSSLIVLFLVPSILGMQEDARAKIASWRGRSDTEGATGPQAAE